MSVEAGRARPYLAAAASAAAVLALVAIAVAVLTTPRPLADPPASPSLGSVPAPDPASPSAEAATCATAPVATPGAEGGSVLVFLGCGTPPAPPIAVVRDLPGVGEPEERLAAALEQLIAGPTDKEAAAGYWSPFPPDPGLIVGVDLQPDGLAIVDLSGAFRDIANVTASSAGGAVLRSLRETALQFVEVTALEIRLEGSCEAFAGFMEASPGCIHLAEPVDEVSDCPTWPPATLPSGAPLTEPRLYRDFGGLVSWGSGSDTITLSVSHRDSIGVDAYGEGAVPIMVAGRSAWAGLQGRELEPGIVRPYVAWDDGAGCVYAAYLAAGASGDEVRRAAGLFGNTQP